MNKKDWINSIIIIVGVGVSETARRILRNKGQKKLQKQVNLSQPTIVTKKTVVADQNIQIAVIEDQNVDLTKFQILQMTEAEINEWKNMLSTLGGETLKTKITTSAFNGLLRCDVPLKDLCRIKNNPDAMRGLIFKDGKISRQASFTKADSANVVSLLAFQCMAAITSQYYQQIITNRLNAIDSKLDNIIKILAAEDCAKLRASYSRFAKLRQKNNYDIADKQIASISYDEVEKIRGKYIKLLSGIDLKINSKLTDKKEAEEKVNALKKSRYFEYLEMAMQAETLLIIASAILIKIAKNLGNEEDINMYATSMNLDYWNEYVDQFNKIKHDVIKYIELEAEAAWIGRESIEALKNNQLKEFNNVEEKMKNLQRQFEGNTIQYIKVDDDGKWIKYIAISQ